MYRAKADSRVRYDTTTTLDSGCRHDVDPPIHRRLRQRFPRTCRLPMAHAITKDGVTSRVQDGRAADEQSTSLNFIHTNLQQHSVIIAILITC